MFQKTLLILLTICLSITFIGNSQNSIPQLAKQLAAKNPTDSLKIRAIFDWITENVAYDIDSYRSHIGVKYVSNEDISQSGNWVFKVRKGVCSGYANLFYELGKAMGVQVEVVEGLARTNSFFDSEAKKLEAHAWNAVKINKRWYLIDATWATGGIEESGVFRFQKNEKYYLMPPQKFLREHYPQDPVWQLSDMPISLEAFKESRTQTPVFSKFSYTDTLSKYENQDSLTRRLASFRRMLLIDPQNTSANHGLGFAMATQAYSKMQAYSRLSAQLQTAKNPAQQQAMALANKEKIFETLASIESTLKQSLVYFERVQKSENFQQNNENIRSSQRNLAQIAAERQRLNQYYALVEKYRKK